MMASKKILCGALLILSGCATLAPSSYELNKRSGIAREASGFKKLSDKNKNQVIYNSGLKEKSDRKLNRLALTSGFTAQPRRIPPRVTKLWVYDQLINRDVWLAGTWMYLEVEKAHWQRNVSDLRIVRKTKAPRKERLK